MRVEQAEGGQKGGDEDVTGESRAAPPPLSRVGDYQILRVIGRGGMGVVYEAEQISLGRRVALKVLPRGVSGDRMVLERFRREARAAARLHHTNIVPVYEVGQDGDVRFYAMQFIQGQSLDLVITDLRRLRDRAESASRSRLAASGRSPEPRGEHSRQATEDPTPGEGFDVSPVLHSILTGRFDPGGQRPERAEARISALARALTGGLATTTRTGAEHTAAESDPALARTQTESIRQATPPARYCCVHRDQPHHHPPLHRQPRRSCPGEPSSRPLSRVTARSFAAWRRSGDRSPGAWLTPTRGGSCTATSSRRTCFWIPKGWCGSRTSDWPRGTTRG